MRSSRKFSPLALVGTAAALAIVAGTAARAAFIWIDDDYMPEPGGPVGFQAHVGTKSTQDRYIDLYATSSGPTVTAPTTNVFAPSNPSALCAVKIPAGQTASPSVTFTLGPGVANDMVVLSGTAPNGDYTEKSIWYE